LNIFVTNFAQWHFGETAVLLPFIGSVLLGAIFGRSFKVLVLAPVSLLILLTQTVRAYCFEDGILSLAAESAVLVTGLQIGYAAMAISTVTIVMLRRIGTSFAASLERLP
jgi:hypothetical protein